MKEHIIRFDRVTFHYESSPEIIFNDISLQFGNGWTGIVGPNGSGKTTLLMLAIKSLEAVKGNITAPSSAIYVDQRTDSLSQELVEFAETYDKDGILIKEEFEIESDWVFRWESLSHGERKRFQLGNALWRNPDVLAVDEPTNHLDHSSKTCVIRMLKQFSGNGIIVSHDRELLDYLCFQCVFIEPPEIKVRKGGVSHGLSAIEKDETRLRKERQIREKEYNRLKYEIQRRSVQSKDRKKGISKRGLHSKDSDARAKIDRVRVTGKDVVGEKLKKQLQGRVNQAEKSLNSVIVKKQYRAGISIPSETARCNTLADIPERKIQLGSSKLLYCPQLTIKPADRIGISGDNGSGKSTLVRSVLGELNIREDKVLYIPQEIESKKSRIIVNSIRSLNNTERGQLLTIIRRLGSDPERIISTGEPSPGETRKLLLAQGLLKSPQLIIMDEPTNHMDIVSIQCLEDALLECVCCIILVSHDTVFLEKVTRKRWKTEKNQKGFRLHVIEHV